MVSRRQREQRKNAGAASVEYFKRRRLENLDNQAQLQLHYDNDEPSETHTDDEARWFWNESANESESDSEEEGDCGSEGDCASESDCGSESEDSDKGEVEKEITGKEEMENEEQVEKQEVGQIDKAAAPKKLQLKWRKGAGNYLRGGYGNGSKATSKRRRKAAKGLEEDGLQSYQIEALWERNRELGMLSQNSTQAESVELNSLSQIPRGQKYLKSKKEMRMEDRKEAFQAMNRLLQLVTEQEKLY